MKLFLDIDSKSYTIDLEQPLDVSIPLKFDGVQPNAFDVPHAGARAFEDGNFIGDTRKGGSCNFEEYRLIPHCNGTHTECVGHIALERISIHSVLHTNLFPATLITVQPQSASKVHDSYRPPKQDSDLIITKEGLERALEGRDLAFLEALLIRTLPNEPSKLSRNYMKTPPPYFSVEAVQFLNDCGVAHLLIDMPSIDRPLDEGKMTNHHLFWGVAEESHDVDPKQPSLKTITEMIYVPDDVADGRYLLDIQIPSFVADAAPSRPLLYPISETDNA